MTAATRIPKAPTPPVSWAAGGWEKLADPVGREALLPEDPDGLLDEKVDEDEPVEDPLPALYEEGLGELDDFGFALSGVLEDDADNPEVD